MMAVTRREMMAVTRCEMMAVNAPEISGRGGACTSRNTKNNSERRKEKPKALTTKTVKTRAKG
jgi:hypothetical protein